MSSIFGFVVGLLQSALALLGFVQVHPELPQVQKDQAQVVAQQAITQATQALAMRSQTTAPQHQNNMVGAEFVVGTMYSRDIPANQISVTVQLHNYTSIPNLQTGGTNTIDTPPAVSFRGPTTAFGKGSVDFGDGTRIFSFHPANPNCSARGDDGCVSDFLQIAHNYATAGTFTAKLLDANGNVVKTATIIVVDSSTNGTQSSISVPGMQKYTDTDFGFSFWYPSGWTVSQTTAHPGGLGYGGNPLQDPIPTLQVSNGTKTIVIAKIASQSGVYDECGKCSRRTYFDASLHQWMYSEWDSNHNTVTNPANVSINTMGGLHIISNTIIPLSAHNFLVIGEGSIVEPLARTIVATDPSVATPVSAAEQIATIQAEKAAYAGQ